jgi:starch synthase
LAQILMVSAEASPFASTGGLGDVLQGLPKALAKQGHKVAVALPLYPSVRDFDPQVVNHGLRFSSAGRLFSANLAQLERAGVQYFFLDLPSLFDRPGLYGEGDVGYPDNTFRYAAFCRGALAIAQNVFTPDIIHCHDWPTGILPVILSQHFQTQPALMGLQTVFTIHNLAYQGPVEPRQAAALNLNGTFKYAHASMLRGALETATQLTTVSPTYAKEICKPGLGCGMEGILNSRADHLHGILNGIDDDLWNPASDPAIPAHYSLQDLSGKRLVKAALLTELGLPPERIHRPLIGVVARLASQKGLDLLSQNPQQFLDLDASLILIGDGNPQEEDFFRWLAAAHPTRVAVKIGFDPALSRRVIAGSDVFLMPSRYEPCGLTQLYAMRYGTLPLVHSTGGLKDTVTKADGFTFENHSWRSLLQCLRDMAATWGTPQWITLQRAAMSADYSWAASAAQYSKLYAGMNHN